jgi:hypothetical protein
MSKYMLGMILRPIEMTGIWILVFFWDENHFHILFDDSTPPFVDNINVTNYELIMITSVYPTYSAMVLFLLDSTWTSSHNVDEYSYLDSHDMCQYLEHDF